MDTKYFLDKYISPHVWEGELYVNGGWGDRNKVESFASTFPFGIFSLNPRHELLNLDAAFGLTRAKEINMQTDLQRAQLLNSENHSVKEINRHYNIAFPGSRHDIITIFLERLKSLKVESIVHLRNYLNDLGPKKDQPLYQLYITVTKEGEIITRMSEGIWIPSFKQVKAVAGW
jgi:hypothetical protein